MQYKILLFLDNMQKQGIIQLKLESATTIGHQKESCSVKMTVSDVSINSLISAESNHPQPYFYLPIDNKIVMEMSDGGQDIGYFEIPMHAIYDYPMRQHKMKINCITKDTIQNTLSPTIFGTLHLSLWFLEGCWPKINLFIDRMVMTQDGQLEREVYIQSKIGNNASKTSLKLKQGSQFVWKEHMHFTLDTVPSKIQLLIKDKDIINDDILGRIEIDPQNEGLLQNGKIKEGEFEVQGQQRKIALYLSLSLTVPENN